MKKSIKPLVRYRYLNRIELGGALKSCEDFIVREVIEPKFLRRFERTSGGIKPADKYLLILLKKRNFTTQETLEEIAKKTGISIKDIGYAGLKDKFSVSYQYITIPAEHEEKIRTTKMDNIELYNIGKTGKKISVGDLIGNEFEITLHGCNLKEVSKAIGKLDAVPNYFGIQRFGRNRNNHIIGRCLVKRDFKSTLKLINSNGFSYSCIEDAPKKMLKFLVHAYQSWLFNEMLNTFMATNDKPKFCNAALFGSCSKLGNNAYDAILKRIIIKEKICADDFRLSELKFSCQGGLRPAFIKISDLDYAVTGETVRLKFRLPKGSYATNVLNALGVKKWI